MSRAIDRIAQSRKIALDYAVAFFFVSVGPISPTSAFRLAAANALLNLRLADCRHISRSGRKGSC